MPDCWLCTYYYRAQNVCLHTKNLHKNDTFGVNAYSPSDVNPHGECQLFVPETPENPEAEKRKPGLKRPFWR